MPKIGAEIVVLKENKETRATGVVAALAGSSQCENCVYMSGVAYKKKKTEKIN
ncbi:MAG: hypothetical protein HOE90_17635 [Bacteriovoracaceae bacterium]|nr:hypothetical protein [Bacteriovoracaceae bacterium]